MCREGRAAEEIAKNLSADTSIVGAYPDSRDPLGDNHPAGFSPWSSSTESRSTTMQPGPTRGAVVEELVRWVSRAFLHMIFRDGFFHCDPHPGNLLVDSTWKDRDHRLSE